MVYPRGKKKTFWYRFWFAGRIIHESARTKSRTLAKEAERARRRQLEEGFNQITRRVMPPAFDKAASDWKESREGRVAPNTMQITKTSLLHLLPVFGSRLLTDITPKDVAGYQQARLREGAQGRTINIEVQTLRQTMKAAKFWKHLEGEIHSLRERKDVGKALSPEQESRLLEECARADSACYTAVCLSLNTTMRSDEVKSLRWHQADLFERILTVGKSKTEGGKGRTIPLNADAMHALAQWAERFPQRKPDDYLFPRCESRRIDVSRPTKGWRTAWRNACVRAGVKVRFHDLRHTAITKLAESQASDQTIMSIAGHVSRAMLEHYSHIRMNAKRAALDAIASRPANGGVDNLLNQNRNQIGEAKAGTDGKLLN
jgi:integrase